MRWSEVRQKGEFTRIIFKQKKTGGQEYLDINAQAAAYMGVHRKSDELVFVGFKYSSYMIAELRMWAVRAGITKDITFHINRHFKKVCWSATRIPPSCFIRHTKQVKPCPLYILYYCFYRYIFIIIIAR